MPDIVEKQEHVNASKFGLGALKPGTIQVTVDRGVTKSDLHNVIDNLTKHHGCDGCGLAGLDLVIRTPDPVIDVVAAGIPSVKDVAVFR
jgi:hypothetical protein